MYQRVYPPTGRVAGLKVPLLPSLDGGAVAGDLVDVFGQGCAIGGRGGAPMGETTDHVSCSTGASGPNGVILRSSLDARITRLRHTGRGNATLFGILRTGVARGVGGAVQTG